MEASAAGHVWHRITWHGIAELHPALAALCCAVLVWMLDGALHHAVAAACGSCSCDP